MKTFVIGILQYIPRKFNSWSRFLSHVYECDSLRSVHRLLRAVVFSAKPGPGNKFRNSFAPSKGGGRVMLAPPQQLPPPPPPPPPPPALNTEAANPIQPTHSDLHHQSKHHHVRDMPLTSTAILSSSNSSSINQVYGVHRTLSTGRPVVSSHLLTDKTPSWHHHNQQQPYPQPHLQQQHNQHQQQHQQQQLSSHRPTIVLKGGDRDRLIHQTHDFNPLNSSHTPAASFTEEAGESSPGSVNKRHFDNISEESGTMESSVINDNRMPPEPSYAYSSNPTLPHRLPPPSPPSRDLMLTLMNDRASGETTVVKMANKSSSSSSSSLPSDTVVPTFDNSTHHLNNLRSSSSSSSNNNNNNNKVSPIIVVDKKEGDALLSSKTTTTTATASALATTNATSSSCSSGPPLKPQDPEQARREEFLKEQREEQLRTIERLKQQQLLRQQISQQQQFGTKLVSIIPKKNEPS
jgi:hypothetical protein